MEGKAVNEAGETWDDDYSEPAHGRWYGNEFCSNNGEPPIDGCYYCGRPVKRGPHDHTMYQKEGFQGATETRYSCVCETC